MPDKKDSLTTTQAARLLDVSPDTVLKWAKAGKIESFRTLGGHYRIPRSALDSSPRRGGSAIQDGDSFMPEKFQYCWEYQAQGGEVSDDCKDCLTYRSRSKRCYELRHLPNGLGCLRVYCKSTCEECDYYQIVQGAGYNVIILTEQKRLLRDRDHVDGEQGVTIRIATNEYECSSLVESFRPDFIVVDCALGEKRTSNVCTSLFNDSRIPVPRIILASRTKKLKEYCDREVFGWMAKPFSVEQLRECIKGVTPRSVPTERQITHEKFES